MCTNHHRILRCICVVAIQATKVDHHINQSTFVAYSSHVAAAQSFSGTKQSQVATHAILVSNGAVWCGHVLDVGYVAVEYRVAVLNWYSRKVPKCSLRALLNFSAARAPPRHEMFGLHGASGPKERVHSVDTIQSQLDVPGIR